MFDKPSRNSFGRFFIYNHHKRLRLLYCMRQIISRMVFVLAYWSGVDALFYWLNCKAKRIVTFHNVLPEGLWRKNLANGVSHSLEDFKAIVRECGKRFAFSTDLLNARTITFTFDDGYHNQFEYAFKTLRSFGIPAYVFVSKIEEGGLLIDKLLHWVANAPAELIPNGDRMGYWVREIWPRFVADRTARGETVFRELDAKYPYAKMEAALSEDYRRERLGGISDDELDEMRRAGWKIGWHTKSHYPLNGLSHAELLDELDCPIEFKGVCFSYPYGNLVEVGDEAIGLVRALGFPCAVSNCNTADENTTSRFFLPRMALSVNKYDLHFELSGAKHFLKTRRLLPVVCGDGEG